MTDTRFDPGPEFYRRLADAHPQIRRGRVWCCHCGRGARVDPTDCLRHGWPLCCGQPMTIDRRRRVRSG